MVDHQHGRGACELILCLKCRAATGISDSPGLCVRVKDILAYPPLCLRGRMGWRGRRGMYQFLKQLILSMRVGCLGEPTLEGKFSWVLVPVDYCHSSRVLCRDHIPGPIS